MSKIVSSEINLSREEGEDCKPSSAYNLTSSIVTAASAEGDDVHQETHDIGHLDKKGS